MPLPRRALVAVAVVTLLSGCGSTDQPPLPPGPAPPQSATLDWVERFPSDGPAVVFSADRLEITASGWSASVELENDTSTPWRIVESPATAFGVMLFTSGDVAEVERRSEEDDLPGLRPARSFDPPLPERLAPGMGWRGTIAAPGRLAAGLHLRIVFGQLVAVGDPPDGMPAQFSWITDNSYELRATRA
jgi:hypothetical protein